MTKLSRNEWVEMDRGYLNRISDRRHLIRTCPDQAHIVGTHDIVNPAIQELYEEVMIKYLPVRFPTMFQVKGSILKNLATGMEYSINIGQLDYVTMLRNLGENVEDDFFFMCPDGEGEFRLQGWIACFPNGFSTLAKLGMSLRTIHQPVPGYEERLGKAADVIFQKMKEGAFACRFNVSHTCTSFGRPPILTPEIVEYPNWRF
jgi:hypothetical protein